MGSRQRSSCRGSGVCCLKCVFLVLFIGFHMLFPSFFTILHHFLDKFLYISIYFPVS